MFSCMYVSVSHACLMPEEVRRGHGFPETRVMEVLSYHVCVANGAPAFCILITELLNHFLITELS